MECLRGLTRLVGAYITKQGIPFLSLIIPVGKRRWRDFRLPEPLRISASAIVDKMLLGACTLLAIMQVAQLARMDAESLVALSSLI